MSSLRQSGSLRLDENESDPREHDFLFAAFSARAPPTVPLTDSWLVELSENSFRLETHTDIKLKFTQKDTHVHKIRGKAQHITLRTFGLDAEGKAGV